MFSLTEYVNDFDQPVIFQCPYGDVLSCVNSYHDNHREDRRFKFYCCEKPGMCLYNCYYSGFVNHFDGDLNYTEPDNHVMRGWTSVHDNHHEDRIFNFDVCPMQQCQDMYVKMEYKSYYKHRPKVNSYHNIVFCFWGNPGETVIGK